MNNKEIENNITTLKECIAALQNTKKAHNIELEDLYYDIADIKGCISIIDYEIEDITSEMNELINDLRLKQMGDLN